TADHNIFVDRGRRSHPVAPSEAALIFRINHAVAQIDKAAFPKAVDRLTRGGVDRPELTIERPEEQSLVVTAAPESGSATEEQHLGLGLVQFGVEYPHFFAGFWLECDQTVERRYDIEHTINQKWSIFERALHRIFGTVAHVARMIGPCRFQCGDIGAIDLLQ